jgi:hypothetical protein
MAGEVVIEAPLPYAADGKPWPLGWCALCMAIWKGHVTSALENEIKSALGRDGQLTRIRPPEGAPHLNLALAWGLIPGWSHPAFGTGGNGQMPFPVPLCVSHMMGVNVSGSVIQPATPDQVPAVPRGAVDLAERAAQQARRGG